MPPTLSAPWRRPRWRPWRRPSRIHLRPWPHGWRHRANRPAQHVPSSHDVCYPNACRVQAWAVHLVMSAGLPRSSWQIVVYQVLLAQGNPCGRKSCSRCWYFAGNSWLTSSAVIRGREPLINMWGAGDDALSWAAKQVPAGTSGSGWSKQLTQGTYGRPQPEQLHLYRGARPGAPRGRTPLAGGPPGGRKPCGRGANCAGGARGWGTAAGGGPWKAVALA